MLRLATCHHGVSVCATVFPPSTHKVDEFRPYRVKSTHTHTLTKFRHKHRLMSGDCEGVDVTVVCF